MEDRGAAEAVLPVEWMIAVGPERLPGVAQRDKAAVAEAGIDALPIGCRRGSGVGVAAFLAPRHLLEDGPVPEYPAACAVQRQHMATTAVVRGGGDENAIAPDDRGGPGLAGQGCFPANIFPGAPAEGKPGLGGGTLTGGAAEAGPVFGGAAGVGPAGPGWKRARRDAEDQEQDGAEEEARGSAKGCHGTQDASHSSDPEGKHFSSGGY